MLELHKFFNRDVSWLSFNYRVLEEAKDLSLPLFERIKFMAIYSSNLDEFYRVRVAYYRSLKELPIENRKSLYYDPTKVLSEINTEVNRQFVEFGQMFDNLIPELAKNNIILYQNNELLDEHREFITDYFSFEVLPNIQPVLLERGNVLSFLQDNVIYLAVRLYRKTRRRNVKQRRARYAIIKIPTHHLPRFIELPVVNNKYYVIILDDVIKQNLDVLFPGFDVDSCYSIKLSRNADLLIEDEFQGDFVEKIKKSLMKRKTGAPSRFLYDKSIPSVFLRLLIQIFNLSKEDLVKGAVYHNLSDLTALPNPLSPTLEVEPLPPLNHSKFDKFDSMLKAIRDKDWLIHMPYQSYKYVIRFLNEAAIDPKVEEIKVTQYRVATNSAIVSALISAAHNGKKVTVFVEVQARFDEEMNLYFSEQMRKAGIKVIASIPGIKVHAKVALVLRRTSKDKRLRGFSFTSTGNFNEKTAKLYADEGFFTYNQDINNELDNLFNHLENQNKKFDFKHILVGQFNMRKTFKSMIDREIANVEAGKRGYMILKMNGLEEPKMIEKLYEAGQKGVKIELIVRGVCRLVPNKSFSKNITVTRIVDRFLEHARVYVYYNNGNWDTYISSADWMKRNLYRRIETAIPIYNNELKKEIREILEIQLADNVKGRLINEKLENIPKTIDWDTNIRSQLATYEYLKRKTSV